MLLNFNEIVKKYNLNIIGTIHIGAHYGQEITLYEKHNIKNILCFEPMTETFKILEEKFKDRAILVNSALGNFIGEVEMYTETINKGQSSSILEPDYHLIQHPKIKFTGKEKVKITKLDEFISEKEKYNFINIDVQGYELEVFKGASEYLKTIDYIISEVSRVELYKGCPRVEDLDIFLSDYGFERVETDWAGISWGDAFYIKNKK
jgi:FkbM family methyltransferase